MAAISLSIFDARIWILTISIRVHYDLYLPVIWRACQICMVRDHSQVPAFGRSATAQLVRAQTPWARRAVKIQPDWAVHVTLHHLSIQVRKRKIIVAVLHV
eukprot:COSAG05_NODE_40_length_27088_cov_92.858276_11_plen_101_part_00